MPSGAGGGVLRNGATIPLAIAAAHAVNAASNAAAAFGSANADSSAVFSVAHAAATVLDGGTIAIAYPWIASAHACAQPARVGGGFENSASSALCRELGFRGRGWLVRDLREMFTFRVKRSRPSDRRPDRSKG